MEAMHWLHAKRQSTMDGYMFSRQENSNASTTHLGYGVNVKELE